MFMVFERRPIKVFVFTALNVASILGGFALMSVLGFELNVSSVMTASIALGMVVDSTIHLMFLGADQKWARATYNPIVLSHIVLFVAFGLLALEPFVPIRDFALGLVMLLGVGLVFDLWVLPMIEGEASLTDKN
jgi:predicted RND superfamily exporter protein